MMLYAVALHLAMVAGQIAEPQVIVDCLDRTPDVFPDLEQNPFYLRGFFDGDQLPDYVVAVIDKTSGHGRILACMGNGKSYRLGFGEHSRFSDMSGGDYVSKIWYVSTKKEFKAFAQFYSRLPEPPDEVVCLLWEDGEAFIYWDGEKFVWLRPKLK